MECGGFVYSIMSLFVVYQQGAKHKITKDLLRLAPALPPLWLWAHRVSGTEATWLCLGGKCAQGSNKH